MISQEKAWFKHALIQQIYPLSFNAPNGGYGTLQGVIDKLDYVKDLGVDAIWISPFFKSPLKTGSGYNAQSYTEIEPTMGTMKDCENLIEGMHKRDMAIILDMVFSHTSDQHPWFEASQRTGTRDARPGDDKYKDFYVWADRKPGSMADNPQPPNNWQNVLYSGGSAWEWSPVRKQYYLHNFDKAMPDLNIYNQVVVEKMKKVLAFWIDKGVDGFRLDAVPFLAHREDLKDTEFPESKMDSLKFEHQQTQERTTTVLKELRAYAKELGEKKGGKDIFFLGESWLPSPPPEERAKTERPDFTSGYDYGAMLVREGALDQVYTAMLYGGSAEGNLVTRIKMAVEAFTRRDENHHMAGLDGMNSAAENHDMNRVVQRWGLLPQDPDPELQHRYAILNRYAILIGKLSLSLPGSHCIFQGQELGLPNADVARDLHREGEKNVAKRAQCDPLDLAHTLYDQEGSRAMMPWSKQQVEEDRGWTSTPPGYADFVPDNNPTHAAYKEFIALRKQSNALQDGNIKLIEPMPAEIIAFTRNTDGDKRLCIFNFDRKKVILDLPDGMRVENSPQLTLEPLEGKVEEFTQRKISLSTSVATTVGVRMGSVRTERVR